MPNQPPEHNPTDEPKLPNNVNDCHNVIKELFARIAELEKQLSRRNRALYGHKSAKVNASLLTGTGKAVHEETVEELDNEKKHLNIVPEKAKGGGRATLSKKLDTREEKYFLEEEQLPCPCCGETREVIGFETYFQIEFVKTLFENIQHTMFKYACKNCKDGQITVAQKPYQAIDKGKAGPGLLAKIATDKFWLHLPLYRQEQVFTAMSIPVGRSVMCRWLAEIAKLVTPIVKRMRELILQSRVVQSDATKLPVIKKGLGKTHQAFIWVYRGDDKHPNVFFDYSDTEHSLYPTRILKGFTGILQTDGTNKYNAIIKEGATAANCWAHVHCDFEDAWKSDPKSAEYPMGVIKSLFDIERFAKTLSERERLDLRQRLAKPKLEALKIWLDEQHEFELPKGKLGEAISYTLNHWKGLLVYLDNPFVEISNNASERNIKPLVIGRRNWMFAGSEEGGDTAAMIMSLIETCKRLDINPFEYLKDVLTRLPSAKTSQIDDFLPDRWLALRQVQS